MTNFNSFLLAMSTVMAFELIWNGVSSDNGNEGYIKCQLLCKYWENLSGHTYGCHISNGGKYRDLIARNPAPGLWRFYKGRPHSLTSLCAEAENGDQYLFNGTNLCPEPSSRRHHIHNTPASKYRFDDSTPSLRDGIDHDDFVAGICRTAVFQLCNQGHFLFCGKIDSCCYETLKPTICRPENLNRFTHCYEALFSILSA